MSRSMTTSHQRFLFIRKLISLAFIYGHDTDLFHKKFVEMVNIKTLKRRQIIHPMNFIPNDEFIESLKDKGLTEWEIEICCLTELGFTAQELCVIYGLKNINSIYVKRHRIKKKLKGEASPEAALVILVLSLITYMLLLSFNSSGL